MTAIDHNKIIGFLFLIFGGCTALLLVPVFLQIVAALNAAERASASGAAEAAQNSQNAIAVLFVLIVVLGATFLIGAAIEVAAGYAMVKQKVWAQPAGVLAGVVALINFPIGTALGLYALWFLLGGAGKQFYRNRAAISKNG